MELFAQLMQKVIVSWFIHILVHLLDVVHFFLGDHILNVIIGQIIIQILQITNLLFFLIVD